MPKSNAVEVTRRSTHGVELSDEGRSYLNQFPEESLAKSLGTRACAAWEDQGQDRAHLGEEERMDRDNGKEAKLSKRSEWLIADGESEYARGL